jgi:D-alanyl-D-alanine carboxypeptidase
MRIQIRLIPLLFVFLAAAYAQNSRQDIDQIATQALTETGVPSASVCIVEDGKMTYAQAYGEAHLDPKKPAQPQMRYAIGSISKQFTATAVLMLQEEGKLTLSDHVDKYVPGLTRGNEVTIRELLSHTSGYQDFWPQDYVPPMMLKEISAQKILDIWARKPLDFDPGTRWQYSNTNYVIAGLIVEKVSGMPFFDFIQKRIFKPLNMQSVADVNLSTLNTTDATGYFRYALGPPRLAPKEGKGWLFAMGELAMTAEDLQKWNISVINQTLLKPESYKELETEVLLNDGSPTGYALGIGVARRNGHRSH